MLSHLRVFARRTISQQDDVFGSWRSAAAGADKHVIVQSLKPGRHVGSRQRALTQLMH